jgi:hypothetical protein
MTADTFGRVAELAGVGSAAAHARDAIDALLRHPAMRRQAGQVAAQSAVRGARASAELAGATPGDVNDPVLQGALRVTGAVPGLAATWSRTPGQALARMHVLAARDLPDADEPVLGRPRSEIDHGRFDQLLALAVAPTTAPAVVVAALVHGELLAVRPFGLADEVLARSAERVVLVARGVDTKAVSIPEAGHQALSRAYGPLHAAYRSGTPDGVATWVRHCCDAYARGAEEGMATCASLAD